MIRVLSLLGIDSFQVFSYYLFFGLDPIGGVKYYYYFRKLLYNFSAKMSSVFQLRCMMALEITYNDIILFVLFTFRKALARVFAKYIVKTNL